MEEKISIPEPPIGYLMSQTHRSLKNALQREFEEAGYDVTVEQMGLLFILWHQEGISQRAIVKTAKKVKSSITRLIDNMEKRNLVVRIPDEKDKRNKRIFLTHKGKKLRGELEVILNKVLAAAQQNIDESDINICKSVLKQMFDNLQCTEAE